tara:strand:+ start:3771 stop:4283 length:513 start_codon:yes stop_codon:yes gene_type:complete
MIEKKILSEISLYYGNIKMPKHWEIDRNQVCGEILQSKIRNDELRFSRTWDKIKTFITDFMSLKHDYKLTPEYTFGNVFEKNEISEPRLEMNYSNLDKSPDFVLLYGVNIDPKTCQIVIEYDDNSRKGKTWTVDLENNKFVMFPSSQRYFIRNKNNFSLNFLLTLTFKYV